jgi:hypothetical protein
LKEDRLRKPKPTTRLCRHTNEAIYYREQDLVGELLGRRGFTAAMFAHILGRAAAPPMSNSSTRSWWR